jgi:hypothetical protein
VLIVVVLASVWLSSQPLPGWTVATLEELDWQAADRVCRDLPEGQRLPSIGQLLRLYYSDAAIDWHPATDYWSSSRLSDYAFGLNSRFGITSFDRIDDQDHLICISIADKSIDAASEGR